MNITTPKVEEQDLSTVEAAVEFLDALAHAATVWLDGRVDAQRRGLELVLDLWDAVPVTVTVQTANGARGSVWLREMEVRAVAVSLPSHPAVALGVILARSDLA